ncbi:hypothetical protein BU15DRAFT_64429 [Melanogaster broomeanus]|nr:hypothetical protein BU15DRAFT_64429 [Melanogaster broomeanus]
MVNFTREITSRMSGLAIFGQLLQIRLARPIVTKQLGSTEDFQFREVKDEFHIYVLLERPSVYPHINIVETTVNHVNGALLKDIAWEEINSFSAEGPMTAHSVIATKFILTLLEPQPPPPPFNVPAILLDEHAATLEFASSHPGCQTAMPLMESSIPAPFAGSLAVKIYSLYEKMLTQGLLLAFKDAQHIIFTVIGSMNPENAALATGLIQWDDRTGHAMFHEHANN